MLIRDYVRRSERLGNERIKINRHLKRGLFEFLRYKKRNNSGSCFIRENKKHPVGNKNKNAVTLSILACQAGQAFRIGQDIQIVVLGSSGGFVRLGIDAPPGANLSRVELHARDKESVHEQG